MALEFGMTADEFWYGNPDLFNAYRTSFVNRKKRESEEKNNEAWLFGLYNYNAFNTVVSNMFKKKGSKQNEYMKEPIDFNKHKKKKKLNIVEKYLNNLRFYATKNNYKRK